MRNTQQTTLFLDQNNDHWGDHVTLDPPPHIFRVLSRNVNTLSPADNFLEWQAAAQALHEYSISVACLQETNIQWSHPILHRIRQILSVLPTRKAKLAHSSSSEVTLGNYQPGGTCTIALGRWTPRARLSEQDSHGLGRWSHIEFEGRDGRRIVVVSAYRSCSQQTRLGSGMYHDQQYRLLLSAHNPRPDPRLQFIDDLIVQIRQWRHQHQAVLICMDANDDVTHINPQQSIGRLLSETDLVDLHHFKHPSVPRPSTYHCGRLTLDFCIGSPEFLHSLVAASILPYMLPIQLTGDHRALMLDFDSHILFGNATPPIYIAQQRGARSNNIPIVAKYGQLAGDRCDEAGINERITAIEQLEALTKRDHHILDDIDNDLTRILVNADAKCRKFQAYPWSPELHCAYLDHKFWTISLSEIRAKRSHAASLKIIKERLGPKFIPLVPPDTVSIRLRRAQHRIREIHREAQQH